MCKIRDWAALTAVDKLLAPPFYLAKGRQTSAFRRAWAKPRASDIGSTSLRTPCVGGGGRGGEALQKGSTFGVAQYGNPPIWSQSVAQFLERYNRVDR